MLSRRAVSERRRSHCGYPPRRGRRLDQRRYRDVDAGLVRSVGLMKCSVDNAPHMCVVMASSAGVALVGSSDFPRPHGDEVVWSVLFSRGKV